MFNKITDNLKTQEHESKLHNEKLQLIMKNLRNKWLSKEDLTVALQSSSGYTARQKSLPQIVQEESSISDSSDYDEPPRNV